MATKEQFEYFKSLYTEEMDRGGWLDDHAKNNLSLVTIYSGFIVLAAGSASPNSLATRIFFLAAVLAMLLAFLLALWASRIAIFEGATTPALMIKEFGDQAAGFTDFYEPAIKSRWAEDRKVKTETGEVVVTVPSEDDGGESEAGETISSARPSFQIQAKLAEIGALMHCKIWVPKGDRANTGACPPEPSRSISGRIASQL